MKLSNITINRIIWLSLCAVMVALDQITKYFAALHLPSTGEHRFIPFLFDLVYVENRGAAWGMFENNRWIFMVTTSVAICLMLFFIMKLANEHKMFCISLTMLLAGGIGNMIDRILQGFVVDFLQFGFWKSFPVFNVADCFVVIGCIMMGIYIIFFDKTILRDAKPVPDPEGKDDGQND